MISTKTITDKIEVSNLRVKAVCEGNKGIAQIHAIISKLLLYCSYERIRCKYREAFIRRCKF